MTAPSPTQVLAQAACNLRAAAPREWQYFVEVFDAYATEITVAVTVAEQNEILVAQGKAKAFLHLLRAFQDCQNISNPKPPSAQTP